MAHTYGPEGAMTTITEDQAFRMHQLSRRLCVALRELEDEFTALMGSAFIRKQDGIYHFESIPVLLDLADESAREVCQMAEAHSKRF